MLGTESSHRTYLWNSTLQRTTTSNLTPAHGRQLARPARDTGAPALAHNFSHASQCAATKSKGQHRMFSIGSRARCSPVSRTHRTARCGDSVRHPHGARTLVPKLHMFALTTMPRRKVCSSQCTSNADRPASCGRRVSPKRSSLLSKSPSSTPPSPSHVSQITQQALWSVASQGWQPAGSS